MVFDGTREVMFKHIRPATGGIEPTLTQHVTGSAVLSVDTGLCKTQSTAVVSSHFNNHTLCASLPFVPWAASEVALLGWKAVDLMWLNGADGLKGSLDDNVFTLAEYFQKVWAKRRTDNKSVLLLFKFLLFYVEQRWIVASSTASECLFRLLCRLEIRKGMGPIWKWQDNEIHSARIVWLNLPIFDHFTQLFTEHYPFCLPGEQFLTSLEFSNVVYNWTDSGHFFF